MRRLFHKPQYPWYFWFFFVYVGLSMWKFIDLLLHNQFPPRWSVMIAVLYIIWIVWFIYVLVDTSSYSPVRYIVSTAWHLIRHPEMRGKLKEIHDTMDAMNVENYYGTALIKGANDGELWFIVSWHGNIGDGFSDKNFFVAIDAHSDRIEYAKIGDDIKNTKEHTLESLVLYSQNRWKYEAQGDARGRRLT